MKTVAWTIAIMVIVSFASAFVGYRMAEYKGQQAVIDASRRAIEQANEQGSIDAEILSTATQKQDSLQQKKRIIIKEIVRHVASNPDIYARSLDARGLCLAQSAARGESGEDCPE